MEYNKSTRKELEWNFEKVEEELKWIWEKIGKKKYKGSNSELG